MNKVSITKTKKQLILENTELRSRLLETEEAVIAIRKGEVDAIVVSGTLGEQIYSISSAETPYRAFIEQMNEGAVSLTKEGIILYCNLRFSELVHEPIETVIGSNIKRFIIPEDKLKFASLVDPHAQNKNEVVITSLKNSTCLKLSISLFPAYLHGNNYILIATDISQLKKKENDLREILEILERHIEELRALRIDNINETIDVKIEKNRIAFTNKKLVKEIAKLNRAVAALKQKQR